ncbi:MAG: hypothetical protein KatS3mg100_439 [Candidatus Parcubacteria bacterium]|nr:MAG: hypothetical protein KatS3mg100_439 [Candidatus Parcubacteria bacterium]
MLSNKTDVDFVFLVHPRTLADVVAFFSLSKSNTLPPLLSRGLEWMISMIPNQTICAVHDTSSTGLRGLVVGIPFTTFLLQNKKNRHRAVKRIQRTLDSYSGSAIKSVGLGALLSSVTQQGRLISRKDHSYPLIATGRLLTVYNVSQLYISLAHILYEEHSERLPVTILGAAGSIGSGVAISLAAEGFSSFYLVDLPSKRDLLDSLVAHILRLQPRASVQIFHDTKKILPKSLGVITATSREDAVISSGDVSPGTFIVDDAQPSDVDPMLYDRDDVVVVNGGAMFSEYLNAYHPLFHLREKHIYSCLAETYLFARFPDLAETLQPHHLPRFPSYEKVRHIGRRAEEVGIHMGHFHNPKRVYTQEDLRQIKTRCINRLSETFDTT